jgi:hypothetical protein
MRRRRGACLAALGALLLMRVFLPQGAQAQEQPSITVTPNTGLVDGQTVTVTGEAFPPIAPASAVVAQCAEPVVLTDVSSVVSRCDLSGQPSFDAEGNLVPTSFTVHEVFTSAGGPLPGGATTYDCTIRNDCSVAIVGFLQPVQATLVGAKAPISFGPNVPATKGQCKNGGWRNLANDQGQPFRNQGVCLGYVVAHRR